jgi:uncharacterized MAPEG superfamily protein
MCFTRPALLDAGRGRIGATAPIADRTAKRRIATQENAMSTEFTMLVWSLALTFVQMLVAATGATLQRIVADKSDNRDVLPDSGWPGRARRAHLDMVENMILFAPLIFIADIAGRDDRMTEIGTQLFFWSRLAFAIACIAGVPRLPTAIWSASAAAMVLIFLQLL